MCALVFDKIYRFWNKRSSTDVRSLLTIVGTNILKLTVNKKLHITIRIFDFHRNYCCRLSSLDHRPKDFCHRCTYAKRVVFPIIWVRILAQISQNSRGIPGLCTRWFTDIWYILWLPIVLRLPTLDIPLNIVYGSTIITWFISVLGSNLLKSSGIPSHSTWWFPDIWQKLWLQLFWTILPTHNYDFWIRFLNLITSYPLSQISWNPCGISHRFTR